jgi:hypothetical protein
VEEQVHRSQRHDRSEQGRRFGELTERAVQRSGADQEPDHGIPRRVARELAPRSGRDLDDVVGTETTSSRGRFLLREPAMRSEELLDPAGDRGAAHAAWYPSDRAP